MEATSWERLPPEIGHRPRVKCTFYEKNLTWQNPASISGTRTGLPGCGPCPGVRIEKRTLECSCVPKRVGAAFCSKTAPFLSCAANKPSGESCAQGGPAVVLSFNFCAPHVCVSRPGLLCSKIAAGGTSPRARHVSKKNLMTMPDSRVTDVDMDCRM